MAPTFRERGASNPKHGPDHHTCQREDAFGHSGMVSLVRAGI
jgi:hypothetical protein